MDSSHDCVVLQCCVVVAATIVKLIVAIIILLTHIDWQVSSLFTRIKTLIEIFPGLCSCSLVKYEVFKHGFLTINLV